MHFEKSLQRSIYAPWKDKYIDYPRLKTLLRDEGPDEGGSSVADTDIDDPWTEADETAFVEELVNVQLEKVHKFQAETIQKLRDQTSKCEAKLDDLLVKAEGASESAKKTDKDTQFKPDLSDDTRKKTMQDVSAQLDSITEQMNELEKYSRINYTGFLKAAKKHDRRRGDSYRVRPIMQVRLAALPFNKEDYSPLLFRLSTMYAFIRQNADGNQSNKGISVSESHVGSEEFVSHKFWVHPENILELKTVILRRLPVLIYNPQSLKIADGAQTDPSITSIYFDNPKFSLYNDKVSQAPEASSMRLRWYGQLSEQPEIYCEKKTIIQSDDLSQEERFTTKEKYVKAFLGGQYKMERDIQKLKDRLGEDSEQVRSLQSTVEDIQTFVKENSLQPMLRANYTRTAFQIPGDSRVRITLDTNLALIREDSLDADRPCREPDEWHRRDIDDAEMSYPFDKIRKGEINRFPFAILEIKVKGGKSYEWVSDLMNSHLVKTAPRFSKFVHGIAQLFDDYVNTLPFWLSEVESDIRKDPHQAFEEEQERRAKAAEDEFAVGSFIKKSSSTMFKKAVQSPVGSPTPSNKSKGLSQTPGKATAEMTKRASMQEIKATDPTIPEEDSDDETAILRDPEERQGGIRSLLPSFSTSKYGRARRQGRQVLPPGVTEPTFWIKDEGPVRVEAKVWLANQRTFIKWQHVAVLLASLSLGLYNAAGEKNTIAQALAIIYVVMALFIGVWGWAMYLHRSTLIRQRSGKDFDNPVGPVVVCIGLVVALVLNFGFKYNAALQTRSPGAGSNNTLTLVTPVEL